MDALLAHDREHARRVDPAEKLQQALDVMRAGIRLKRSTLRRQFPDADETEVDQRLAEWLSGDG
jgi:Rv0078B-related antitoxin